MIISDTFVYIHHPKTGGTFVTEMLRKLADKQGRISFYDVPGKKHSGISRVPPEHRDKKIVINVRNTFDHYVSRYKFGWWGMPENANKMFIMDKVLSDYPHFPDLNFSEFMTLFNSWKYRRHHQARKRAGMLADRKIGYNTWTLLRLSLPNVMRFVNEFDRCSSDQLAHAFSHVRFLRTERLNEELFDFLRGEGHPSEDLHFILDSGIVLPKLGGRAKSDTWREYFSEKEINEVLECDRLYFRLFPDMLPEEMSAVD